MALDGAMMRLVAAELEEKILGSKVDKIHQPSREELVFVMRGKNGTHRLLISARASFPRINLTGDVIENPAQPPMLCMFLRKTLCGSRLAAVRQPAMDRILALDFEGFSELGDRQTLTLIVEIMGRCSNAVLVDKDMKIIEALKRVDGAMSSARMILPGLHYTPPPVQDKLDPLAAGPDDILDRIFSLGDIPLHKAVLSSIMGISPIIARELAYRACRSVDLRTGEISLEARVKLRSYLVIFKELLEKGGQPTMVCQPGGKPFDVSVMRIEQYGTAMITRDYPDYSSMLDAFSGERDLAERMKVKSHDVLRILANASDRVARRLAAQGSELEEAKKRDSLRLYGDLINANIYRMKKGDAFLEAENYMADDEASYNDGTSYDGTSYDGTSYEGNTVKIALDPRLTPAQNAQRYYKEYRRKQTAQARLEPLIEQGQKELEYLDAVFDALSRASTNAEVSEIRAELVGEGYIRKSGKSDKTGPKGGKKAASASSASLPPLRFVSDDGFEILVGRNNRQNDRLTLRDAAKNDIWLHTLKIPGAHVIIRSGGEKVPDSTIEQAAVIAACHSRGRESGLVPVDYTLAKHVFKQNGAKPGMVNYTDQRTVYVRPDAELAKRLSSQAGR